MVAPAPSADRDGGEDPDASTVGQPDRVSRRWTHLEIRQRNKATDVIIRIAQSVSVELHPGVGEKFARMSAHPDADDRAANSSAFQHARESHRPDQALRTENPETRGADNREREATGLRQSSRIRGVVRGNGGREGAHWARAHRHVRG